MPDENNRLVLLAEIHDQFVDVSDKIPLFINNVVWAMVVSSFNNNTDHIRFLPTILVSRKTKCKR